MIKLYTNRLKNRILATQRFSRFNDQKLPNFLIVCLCIISTLLLNANEEKRFRVFSHDLKKPLLHLKASSRHSSYHIRTPIYICTPEQISAFHHAESFPMLPPHFFQSIDFFSFSPEEITLADKSPLFASAHLAIKVYSSNISLSSHVPKQAKQYSLPFLRKEHTQSLKLTDSIRLLAFENATYEFENYLNLNAESITLSSPLLRTKKDHLPKLFSFNDYAMPSPTISRKEPHCYQLSLGREKLHLASSSVNLHLPEECFLSYACNLSVGEPTVSISKERLLQQPVHLSKKSLALFAPAPRTKTEAQETIATHFSLEKERVSQQLRSLEFSVLFQDTPQYAFALLPFAEATASFIVVEPPGKKNIPFTQNVWECEMVLSEQDVSLTAGISYELKSEEFSFRAPTLREINKPNYQLSYAFQPDILEDRFLKFCYLSSAGMDKDRKVSQLIFAKQVEFFEAPLYTPIKREFQYPLPDLDEESSPEFYVSLDPPFQLTDWNPILAFVVKEDQKTSLLKKKVERFQNRPHIPFSFLMAKRALTFPIAHYLTQSTLPSSPEAMPIAIPKFPEKNPLKEHMLALIQSLTVPKMKADVSRYIPSLANIALFEIPSNQDYRAKEKEQLEEVMLQTPYNFALMPTLSDLDTISYRDEYTIQSEIMPRSDDLGYIFSVTIKPLPRASLKRSSQNIFFLIDRSGGVEPFKFQVFQRSVEKAMQYVSNEDTFNIAFFDSKISYLEKSGNLSPNPHSLARASAFLRDHERGAYFSESNIYNIIRDIQTTIPNEGHTTFVLLTNGKTLKTLHKQRDKIWDLLNINNGSFSIYTAAVGRGNQLAMLDLLSKLNHGDLLYSETNAAFPRKLALLVKDLDNPMAENVRVQAVSNDPSLHVQLFPATCTLPLLYQEKPFTVYGTVSELKDFYIVIQGKSGDKWVNISKPVSLKETMAHSSHLPTNFTLQRMYSLYYDYVMNPNLPLLDEIERLGKSCNSLTPL